MARKERKRRNRCWHPLYLLYYTFFKRLDIASWLAPILVSIRLLFLDRNTLFEGQWFVLLSLSTILSYFLPKRVNSSLDKEVNRKPYVFERLDA